MMRNDLESINSVLEEWYEELRDDIRLNKELYYNAHVFKQPPATPIIPNIQVDLVGIPKSQNLSYGERKWTFMVDVNIYTQDKPNFPRRIIGRDLEEKVFDFFEYDKGLKNTFNKSIPNLDRNIHRINLKFRGVYDMDTGIVFKE